MLFDDKYSLSRVYLKQRLSNQNLPTAVMLVVSVETFPLNVASSYLFNEINADNQRFFLIKPLWSVASAI